MAYAKADHRDRLSVMCGRIICHTFADAADPISVSYCGDEFSQYVCAIVGKFACSLWSRHDRDDRKLLAQQSNYNDSGFLFTAPVQIKVGVKAPFAQ